MSVYSPDQIKALAPDAASWSAAQGLSHVKEWSLLATDAQHSALWGEIKGSGKKPYQIGIDLGEPAFKCTCPSRKFPCKHGLALLSMYAQEAASFGSAEIAPWVGDWLTARANKAAMPDKATVQAAALADLSDLEREAALRKQAKKAQKLAADKAEKAAVGVAQCSLFLQDILRTGLGQLAQHAAGFEPMAAQLVDAQLPGLARLLRQAASIQYSGAGWEARLLASFAHIELILAAQRKREWAQKAEQPCPLPGLLQADLDQALGYTLAQEQVLQAPGVQGQWLVLGHTLEHEAAIRTRRTWLREQSTGRSALLLGFAAGNQTLPAPWLVGQAYAAELVFYPSAVPLRALPKGAAQRLPEPLTPEPLTLGVGAGQPTEQRGIRAALEGYALALAQLPWLTRWPMVLWDVCFQWSAQARTCVQVVDSVAPRLSLSVSPDFQQLWRCLALTGNAPFTLAGEWDGVQFLPLSLHHAGRCYALHTAPSLDSESL
jgi:hypothetical protein